MMILLCVLLYILLPSTVFILFLLDLPFFGVLDTINYLFSIFSYFFILNHILITTKLPWLQRWIPYDKIVKFHVISGTFIITAIYSHGAYKILIGKYIDLLTWILLGLFTILYLLSILWIEAPGVRRFRSFLLKRLHKEHLASYDKLKLLHGYLFVLLAIGAFLHIREAGVIDGSFTFNRLVPLIYPILVIGLFLYSKFRKVFLPKLVLTSSEQYQGTTILTFTEIQPGNRITYRSGQFGYLRWVGKDTTKEEHPFSFLSSPSAGHVSLAIKDLGDYTQGIKDIPLGSIAKINGGFGNFIPDYTKGKVCLIGSGIGIVPILSLLQDLKEHQSQQKILCFLAVNSREELLIEDILQRISNEFENLSLNIQIFEEDHILFSRNYFEQKISTPLDYNYYLCSSPGVRGILMEAFSEMGIQSRQIHFEAFSF